MILTGFRNVVFLEVKAPDGTQRPSQKTFQEEVEAQQIDRISYVIWRSVADMWEWMEAVGIIQREGDSWRIVKRRNGTP